ncbi:TetR/AcrR family transcriptional regulator [Amycolatopsis magusensis]|uniref:AcrR family transcriptional regulator n=1 Tax=Amycolatopsis magusensis TaxID=882444 RepID=A0ABS4PQB7_9PSEU|nr:TetR family transcriptional regulator C-terminal domain-containing protein [Amycolatopsis magusensis]MBP2181617.1 AcrR family transcriptional regulator [Amycolatopsis magusensis]
MPKIVDPGSRRTEVAEAVFRVVVTRGLAQASLRNVAAEAGLAIGSVRHYFTGSDEMIEFALEVFIERVSVRVLARVDDVRAASSAEARRAAVEELLAELLPLDDERYTECVVWLAFADAARTSPRLQPLLRKLYDGTRMVIRKVLERSAASGNLTEGLDIEVEVERLGALIDGLLTDGVVQPDRMTPELSRAVLRAHLDSISRSAG